MTSDCYSNLNNSKESKKKFAKTFDLSQIAEDPMDIYLESIGLWKKRIARDGSCLFRAVAEQIYPCQFYHNKVREECVRFLMNNRQDYEKFVNIPFDQYINSMKDPLEYGGQLEIHAMSRLYKRDFIIYQQPQQPGTDVTQNGFSDKILLCYSFNNHFDAIFTKTYRDHLALVQSLVYEILYDKVYGSAEQVDVARMLLRKSDTIYPKDYMNAKDGDCLLEDYDDFNDLDENNNCEIDYGNKEIHEDFHSASKNDKYNGQKMPLPYKVAKSLDPVIYRNTAFDAWLATKKDDLNQKMVSMLPGDKCLIRLSNEYRGNWIVALLQNINNNGSATVLLPDLRQSHCIPLENIKPFNTDMMNSNHVHNVQKHVQPMNSQFSSIFSNSTNRKPKKKPIQIKKSSSFHAFSGLEPLPEENEELNDEYFHSYGGSVFYSHEFGATLPHSQSVYAGFSSDKISLNSNSGSKGLNNSNKNRRSKNMNQNKTWSNQNFNTNNLVGMGEFQNNQMPNDPLSASVFTSAPPIYATANSLPGTPISQQNYQNAAFPPSPYLMTHFTNMNGPLLENKTIEQQKYECKRHQNYDSPINKPQQNQTSLNSYQQVPQHTIPTTAAPPPPNSSNHINPGQTDLNNTSTNNYLLMPAPNVTTTPLPPPPPPTFTTTHTGNGGMQRSYSCHAGISTGAFEANQVTNTGHLYYDYYMPPAPHQNNTPIFTQATAAPLIVQPSQTVLINSSNGINGATTSSFSNNCLDNSLSNYDLQFPRLDTNPALTSINNGLIDDSILNINDPNRIQNQNIMWNQNKLNKNENSFADPIYSDMQSTNQQFCYPNYVIINVDGQINYNAQFSYLDDGSDLNLADMNTLRYFYNLGIEHYRMCLTNNTSYNQTNYSNNYMPNTLNPPPIVINPQQLANTQTIEPITNNSLPNNQNNNKPISSNNNNNNNIINNDIDKINTHNTKNQATIIENNNNIITNQLVPTIQNNKSTFMTQNYNNTSSVRRQ